MADDYQWKARIDVEVTNSAKTTSDLDRIVALLEKLNSKSKKALTELVNLNENILKSAQGAGKAVKEVTKETEALNDSLTPPRVRYALYDVAQALQGVEQATIGAVKAVVDMGRAYETAFTDIQRTLSTNDGQLGAIGQQLRELSTQIPVSFQDLAKIGQLGAQLGIAASDITGFTKTVAQFSSLSGVSIEEAAKSFGSLSELLNVPTREFDALGSAIAQVGVDSVATEKEILSVANQIGGVGSSAGLSADFVIGLSGSLASLRIPAEQSRGALTKVFQEINRSVSEGGPKLEAFARVMNTTTAQAKTLAATDMEAFFMQLVAGLAQFDSASLTGVLDELNLNELRVTNVLTKLSGNLPLVTRLTELSGEAYANAGVLTELYAFKVEDLDSKIQILTNSWNNLLGTLGSPIGELIKPVVDIISDFVKSLEILFSNSTGQAFASVIAGFVGLIGAIAALAGGSALTIASIYALRTAIVGLNFATATSGAKQLVAVLFGLQAGSRAAAAGFLVLRGAGIALGLGIITAAVGLLVEEFAKLAESSDQVFTRIVTDTSGLGDALAADITARNDAIASGNQKLIDSFTPVKPFVESVDSSYQDYQDTLRRTADVLGVSVPSAIGKLNGALNGNTRYVGDNTRAWIRNTLMMSEEFQKLITEDVVSGLDILGVTFDSMVTDIQANGLDKTLEGYNEKLDRLLSTNDIDYATWYSIRTQLNGLFGTGWFNESEGNIKDLAKLIEGTLNAIGFTDIPGVGDVPVWIAGLTEGFDEAGKAAGGAAAKIRTLVDYANDLSSTFSRSFDIRWKSILSADDLADSWDTLSKRIGDARNQILGLTATRDRLEYFLSIAVKAGDQVRANEILAELAKTNEDLADATDNASTELNGNSTAARKNRRALTDILRANADYVSALAEQGVSQEELIRITGNLDKEFRDQAASMGYSDLEVQQFTASFGDMNTIIRQLPRDITVNFNSNPAILAMNEFVAKAKSSGAAAVTAFNDATVQVGNAYNNLQALFAGKPALQVKLQAVTDVRGMRTVIQNEINYVIAQMNRYGYNNSAAIYIGKLQQILASIAGYASGGYTGQGGKYQVAGVVHKGEYVIPKEMVNQSTGLPYADALGRAKPQSAPAPTSFANGGFAGGAMMVELSPADRALLRSVGSMGDVVVAVDSREIARANARGARLVTSEGGYLV